MKTILLTVLLLFTLGGCAYLAPWTHPYQYNHDLSPSENARYEWEYKMMQRENMRRTGEGFREYARHLQREEMIRSGQAGGTCCW